MTFLTGKWMLAILLISQVFLYAARVPMHRALRNLGRAIGGGFRLAARWCQGISQDLSRRGQELALANGREATGQRIEREFRRIEATFAKDLARIPDLHRRLDDHITKLEADYEECSEVPPPSPEWGEVVKTVAKLPSDHDPAVRKVLEEFHKSAVAGEKKAFNEYKAVTAKRHGILGSSMSRWKELRSATKEVGASCDRALQATTRIDGYMERYESALEEKGKTRRIMAWHAVNTFVISAIVMAVALGGAFINFQLIALPMSELVPAGSRLMGIPMPSIAALVLVLMEIAAGIFAMEMLGVTNMFAQLGHLSTGRRRLILGCAIGGLFLLAGIESTLAILREQMVVAESALKMSLGGVTGEAVAEPVQSKIPVIGQAVLGFILPWILAMMAIPLEMLIATSGPVLMALLGVILSLVASATRLLGHMFQRLAAVVSALYDVYIVIPLQIERMIKRNGGPLTRGKKLRNPTEESGRQAVVR
jgi:hypothetical protein